MTSGALRTDATKLTSIQAKYYDSFKKSTVYFMQPKTNNIYLMDPRSLKLVGESLKWTNTGNS